MIISKKIVIPMAAVAIVAAGVYGVTAASAASTNNGGSLAATISSAFGLDQSKVQSAINQYRSGQSTQREAKYEQRLSQAVSDGKITSTQEAAILAEHNKLDAEVQAAMSKTGSDRRSALQVVRTEAQTWAKSNNVSANWLLGPGRIRGGHGAVGPSPSASPAA